MDVEPDHELDDGVGPHLGGRVAAAGVLVCGLLLAVGSSVGMRGLGRRRVAFGNQVATLLGLDVPGVTVSTAALVVGRVGLLLAVLGFGLLCYLMTAGKGSRPSGSAPLV